MTKQIELNVDEQQILFDIFDRVRYSWGTVHDHEDLMSRIENELKRGDKNEPVGKV